ncbi:hypothetical protein VE03_00324 [Pseudogymnoascus sp. 23342-1-I1]|nr:hypothetical protein VE03_00324 [Pseudogymnoascus sp. 23342-1-I1]
MIDPSERFWICGEQVRGPIHIGQVIDWDQRRWYSITGPVTYIPPEEDVDIDVRYVGQLGQTVHSITVDDNGLLHSQLTEEDRLGPTVDLVSYTDDSGAKKLAVFKYYMIYQRRSWIWKELHLNMALPRHPNIVPLDRVVLSGAGSRLIDFTTPYIPNGTIEENKDRVFKLVWLQQLLGVVDYLNLELGVIHQDIAPRNLLVNPETDNLLLFDSDCAARIGQPGCFPERNDVKGVVFTLYEIISGDDHFRSEGPRQQDPNSVLSLENWPVNIQLDSHVGEFRKLLEDWIQPRK